MKTRTPFTGKQDITPENSVTMTFDEEGAVTLMSNLTNLYAKPEEASAREIIANAMDAHDAVGQTKPVDIFFPTSQYDYFVVQDYGIGMSKDDLVNVYAKYGASTKRKTNKQRGGFGLGAKAALAVANRFDITSIKDGEKTVGYVQKQNDKPAVLVFLSHGPTKEANGTKISLQLNQVHSEWLSKTGSSLLRGYKPETFRINNKKFSETIFNPNWLTIKDGAKEIAYVNIKGSMDSSVSFQRRYDLVRSIIASVQIRVGGIIYPLTEKVNNYRILSGKADTDFLLPSVKKEWSDTTYKPNKNEELSYKLISLFQNTPNIILNAPIGSIQLTPSRESLVLSDQTKQTVIALLESLVLNAENSFADLLNSKNEINEVYKIAASQHPLLKQIRLFGKNLSQIGPKSFSWRGKNYSLRETSVAFQYFNKMDKRATSDLEVAEFPLPLVRVATLLGPRSTKNHSGMQNIQRSQILVTEVATTAEQSLLKKNIVDLSFGLTSNKSVVAYFTPLGTKQISSDTVIAFQGNVLTLTQALAVSKQARKERASKANRPQNRAAGSYYHAEVGALPLNTIQKKPIANIEDKDVIYVHESQYRCSEMWDRMTRLNSFHESIGKQISYLASDKQVIFLQKTLSLASLDKKFPKAKSLAFITEQKYKEAVTSENIAVFQDLLSLHLTLNFDSAELFSTLLNKVSTGKNNKTLFTSQQLVKEFAFRGKLNSIAQATAFLMLDKNDEQYKWHNKLMEFQKENRYILAGERYYTLATNTTFFSFRHRINRDVTEEEAQRVTNTINLVDSSLEKI